MTSTYYLTPLEGYVTSGGIPSESSSDRGGASGAGSTASWKTSLSEEDEGKSGGSGRWKMLRTWRL